MIPVFRLALCRRFWPSGRGYQMMHCLKNLEAMGMEDLVYMMAQHLVTKPKHGGSPDLPLD